MAKKSEASSMRGFFGLQAVVPAEEQLQPAANTQEQVDKRQMDIDTTPQEGGEKFVGAGTKLPVVKTIGRPSSNVERVPVTLSVKSETDDAIGDLMRPLQTWRGRRRGVPKVGRNDVVDFAIEYLQKRILEGAEAAEDFYHQRESQERNTYLL